MAARACGEVAPAGGSSSGSSRRRGGAAEVRGIAEVALVPVSIRVAAVSSSDAQPAGTDGARPRRLSRSALSISVASAKRCSGLRCRERATVAASAGETSGVTSSSRGGGPVSCRRARSVSEFASYGSRPASSW